MRVLIVDDDPAVRQSLERSLRFEGYEVATAGDGVAALELIARDRPDIAVLDVMMPRMDGLEACRQLRARGDDLPVLMLTARDGLADRVSGLDVGADDYLVKPFALEELFARLRALARRSALAARTGGPRAAMPAGGPAPLCYGGVMLDPSSRQVTRDGRELTLTKTEFELLELFLTHPRQVLSRSMIMERVWGYDFGPSSNSLEVFVSYLRRKLEAGGEPRLLHTVRGVGYVLREQPGPAREPSS
ncbi:response regulator transcription factor [Frankia sp. CNm7]|uniref:Response regulator transcription factor n=1 Tax=Frankia nepalensis TaxID=1836974 RepID=A0A937RH80_9ACTN|nr:response regulator transcription factor [Frankia nepalensis]MBL7495420.1 response regulator transcription factor [Frankia nepalensis]MBL7515524.1 response regulator transcription factor [Frankia nepalensis]MBL7518900.1 response regulator transcription factor [Frankia nepalensis]MBL7625976.1 response regulator transcription factor [Frankia nepalensis]